ncbi:hypothetical protein EG328_010034 [Venturia inaequalis]|uniref:DUF159-domain-containing protein n=1 Tax=Venturia inaequalis TaxID=5025 RepID=A0A8H3YMD7_VENIN|nr:hypothetical protein EG328_010034 [Venturia inaequalis]RDI89917.1 hypothetical protein Vi05172_g157 [Venturia inaequalis]
MCGRYAFFQRPSEVRRQFAEAGMPADECPGDDECRQTYNFPPGTFGLVYRADVPDYGAGPKKDDQKDQDHANDKAEKMKHTASQLEENEKSSQDPDETHYKLQAMKWGLIPAWTKRNPDYGSMMKTINCRDDSLMENKGMWNVVKRKKRCIVMCQGFYEWLKKGKDKIPHYVKRKDGQLMCMAGLWDCAKYEGSDDKHYTYTVITTSSNKQLKFLHERMPVILDNGSDALRTWLDPGRYEWTEELQSLLKPYDGELDIYPVSKDVGKVGNNSPTFIIPIDSAENKSNIANFFGNQKKKAKEGEAKQNIVKAEQDAEKKDNKVEHEVGETRATTNEEGSENNAPLPSSPRGVKREHGKDDEDREGESKVRKTSPDETGSPEKSPAKAGRKMRSATSNGSASRQPPKGVKGTQRITNFFGK